MSFNLPTLPSIHSIMTHLGVGGLLAQVPFLRNYDPYDAPNAALDPFFNAPSCPTDGPLSCHSTNTEASCCFITPGGQLLQTQFWDTSPPVGPIDSWTLHGLWYIPSIQHCIPAFIYIASNEHKTLLMYSCWKQARPLRWHLRPILHLRSAIYEYHADHPSSRPGRSFDIHEFLLAAELGHGGKLLGT
jgi:hypothetical protein